MFQILFYFIKVYMETKMIYHILLSCFFNWSFGLQFSEILKIVERKGSLVISLIVILIISFISDAFARNTEISFWHDIFIITKRV